MPVVQEKPSWNKYDNIWKIREKHRLPTLAQIEEALTKEPMWPVQTDSIGKGIIYYGPAPVFIYAVAHIEIQKKTVWKIICPSLEKPTEGSIYYIIETKQGNLIYKASYGYLGGGPLEASLIEACLEKLGFRFEVQDGSYLLGFL